ncbi:unnamed protein product [Cuscuta campestris]|uniref:Reverse transcriptase domain-containing protein n=1 Tax=Cuscuta campestris TaxID=132261 RepID=A0A484MHN2_9ASTE|nr:unnamed protein product [Cuscuta campestris]
MKKASHSSIVWDFCPPIFAEIFEGFLEGELKVIEEQFDTHPTPEMRSLMEETKAKLIIATQQEYSYWKQKANIKWTKEGDANTAFFHSTVKIRRSQQKINSLKSKDGKWLHNHEEIHEEILNHYKTLFMYKESHNDRFTANIPNLITQMDNNNLTYLTDENEVKEAVWTLSADSAAGPDGFNGHFYKTCWEQIKVDCTKAVQEFFLGIPIPKMCAQTTIILIPKKENSQSCEDYRPICLSNFCCNIFSKILSQRLSSILPRLISLEQGGICTRKGDP